MPEAQGLSAHSVFPTVQTVGYGHDESVCRAIVSNLRLVGYDGVHSIEHEESLLAADEGFQTAIAFLREVMIEKSRIKTWFEMEHEAIS